MDVRDAAGRREGGDGLYVALRPVVVGGRRLGKAVAVASAVAAIRATGGAVVQRRPILAADDRAKQ